DNYEAVQALLDHGANKDQCNKLGMTPTHYAAMNGSVSVLRFLNQKGVNMNAQDLDNKNTPLHFASWNGHIEAVRFLLSDECKKTVDFMLRTAAGYTAAGEARFNKHQEIAALIDKAMIGFLSQPDADLSKVDEKGWTPAHQAAWNGSVPVLRVLNQ